MSIERLSAGDEMMLGRAPPGRSTSARSRSSTARACSTRTGRSGSTPFVTPCFGRLAAAPRLRQRIVQPRRGLGPPFWVDVAHVKLTDHVLVRSARPGRGRAAGGRRGAYPDAAPRGSAALGDVASHRPAGSAGRAVRLAPPLHRRRHGGDHALRRFLDPIDPPSGTAAPGLVAPAPGMPSSAELLVDNLHRQVPFVRRVASTSASPVDAWQRSSTVARDARAAGVESGDQDPAQSPGRPRSEPCPRPASGRGAFGASPWRTVRPSNDVLLALAAGGIRAAIVARGAPVADMTTSIYVPVSLRRGLGRRPERTVGTASRRWRSRSGWGDPDPSSGSEGSPRRPPGGKRLPRPALGAWFRGGFLTRLLLRVVAKSAGELDDSVPAKSDRRLEFAGAPLSELYPVVPADRECDARRRRGDLCGLVRDRDRR